MKITNVETEDVTLKLVEDTDYDAMRTYLTEEETMYFFDTGIMNKTQIIDLMQKQDRIFLVVDKMTSQVIGHFIYGDWFMQRTKEISWVLSKPYQNKGIMTRLAKAVIDFAFKYDDVHRIVATCQPENIPSVKLCKKLGMRLEGHFKSCIYVERLDQWWDELFFAITEDDYKSL
jgi:RimJ/RimL family protein N-acetyltransferase